MEEESKETLGFGGWKHYPDFKSKRKRRKKIIDGITYYETKPKSKKVLQELKTM